MSIDPILREMMLQTVSIQPRASLNTYGEQSYGAAAERTCRIEETMRLVYDSSGQRLVSSTTVYLDDVYGTLTTDFITLPDGRTPSIVTVAVHYDEVGPSHEVLSLL